MGKIIAVLTIVILGVAFFVFGRDVFFPPNIPFTEPKEMALSDNNKVVTAHAFKDGIHRYSGVFKLPHSCFLVDETGTFSGGRMLVNFKVSDEHLTKTPCLNITTRYPFTVLVEAPGNVEAVFFINDVEVPSQIRTVEWQSVAGTMVDTSATTPGMPLP